ncbi:MAG TPA: hypothetical protein PLW40_04190 [Syntrophales bacterium]|nr:hypothetical protein [Syntrophales bacterium]HOM06872.1 hypothetical protein [Syntrophales bacterium]HPQ06413.1 hypothetical protein [Syntrophales bacterium]
MTGGRHDPREIRRRKIKALGMYVVATRELREALEGGDYGRAEALMDRRDELVRVIGVLDRYGSLEAPSLSASPAADEEIREMRRLLVAAREENERCADLLAQQCLHLREEIARLEKGEKGLRRYGARDPGQARFLSLRS